MKGQAFSFRLMGTKRKCNPLTSLCLFVVPNGCLIIKKHLVETIYAH